MSAQASLRVNRQRLGMTLAELLVVLSIMAILSALLMPALSATMEQSRQTVTEQDLVQLRAAILDQYYVDHAGQLPGPTLSGRVPHPQLVFLYVNGNLTGYDPVTAIGWKGPYLKSNIQQGRYLLSAAGNFSTRYGEDGDYAPLDGWGHPIVLQQPIDIHGVYSSTRLANARLVSAGPDGVLNTPPDVLIPTALQRGDDLLLWLGGTP